MLNKQLSLSLHPSELQAYFSFQLKKSIVNPDKPFAFGLPSSEAVLQADNITISELRFNFSISETVRIPSLSLLALTGGVNINPGSPIFQFD